MIVLSISDVRADPTILGKYVGEKVYIVDNKKRSVEAVVEVQEVEESVTLPAEFTGVKHSRKEETQ